MFNHPDSLGYNLHHTVLNSKNFGVPQNRERVFIVGIRKDLPNSFRFPAGYPLTIRLKDILETDVDEKYYLSERMLNYLNTRKDNFNNGKINYKHGNDIASCINASSKSLDISDNIIVVNNNGILEQRELINCIDSNYHKGLDNHQQRSFIQELQLNKIAQLDGFESDGRIYDVNGLARTIKGGGGGGAKTGWYKVEEVINNINGMTKYGNSQDSKLSPVNGLSQNLSAGNFNQPKILLNSRIRRLTPLECARLQAFPDSFIFPVSDTQKYKQCGNSITVNVIQGIIKNLLPVLI